jgi:acetolactate synthase regulatory subunit
MLSVTAAEPATSFPSSADNAPRANSVPRDVHCFAVAADPSPGLLPRVLELIAKRGLVPLRVHAALEGTPRTPDAEVMTVDVQVAGLDADTAAHVARCLTQLVGVFDVTSSAR